MIELASLLTRVDVTKINLNFHTYLPHRQVHSSKVICRPGSDRRCQPCISNDSYSGDLYPALSSLRQMSGIVLHNNPRLNPSTFIAILF
jgi:hypothetical protein